MVELDPELKEYLTHKSKSTRGAYASAYRIFIRYYQKKYGKDKNFTHFLDLIFAELKKPLREQRKIIETEIGEFINYQKAKGKSNNSIRLYVAAIQNFLKYKNITVSISFIGNMPKPIAKKTNHKHEWRIGQIRKFVETAKNYRDKAIILCMFQSGLAVNEICELIYGDIQDEFEKGILPICLKLIRKKTSVEFKTFFGRDSVKYLRLYLATRKDLKPNSPLFTKHRTRGGEERMTTSAIQQSFSEIAKDLPFIKQNGGYNPARPHSLRAGFNSQLIGKIDETLREFWMGHTIGGVARAYLNMPTDELRKLYMTAEEYLKIEKTSRDELNDKAQQVKLLPEVEEKIKLLTSEIESQREEIVRSKVEINQIKSELSKSNATVKSWQEIFENNYLPLLKFVNDLSEMPEFEELKKRMYEEKQKRLQEEAREG